MNEEEYKDEILKTWNHNIKIEIHPAIMHAVIGMTDELFELDEAMDPLSEQSELGDLLYMIQIYKIFRPNTKYFDSLVRRPLDYLKRMMFYGVGNLKGLDMCVGNFERKILKEISKRGFKVYELRQTNIDKLRVRGKKGFSGDGVNNRDYAKEMRVFENRRETK